ncbi:hypothetical protein TYRP_010910 [Tyrophagus putrescentiae]|nr:hypothetical protein TYRP_010910 [Tyrophagus putrescentiae]
MSSRSCSCVCKSCHYPLKPSLFHKNKDLPGSSSWGEGQSSSKRPRLEVETAAGLKEERKQV